MSSSSSLRSFWARPSVQERASYFFPALFLLLTYWPVWDIWFRADDFAWLGLRLPVNDGASLLKALFEPMAQGTVRFLSERAFFLFFSSVFGNDPLPMRVFILLVQMANVGLLVRLTWRLSGSRVAAALVPCLWILNPGTAVSISWLSTWNQLLVVFFLLAALAAFIERRMALCWTSFLLGFGALEINIVFPGLLLVYVWLYERDRLREVWPFFVPSLLFTALHLFVIPKNKQDPTYQLFLDAELPRRLSRYWKWGLGFWRYVDLVGGQVRWERIGSPLLSIVGLGTLAWAAWKHSGRARLALFGAAWFIGLLLPVLPLKNHFSDYYLASASVGMAMIFAVALVEAWKWNRVAGTLVALAVGVMMLISWSVHQTTIGWYRSHAQPVERLVRGVVEARRLHPEDVILLDQMDNSLFWDGMLDDPFRLYLVFDVFLTPGSEKRLAQSIAGDDFSTSVFPPEDTRFLLEHDAAQVYRIETGPLRNVTRTYHLQQDAILSKGAPRFIDVSKAAYRDLLGPGWHPVDNRARWCGNGAKVSIGGPNRAGQALRMTGYAPEMILGKGPQVMTVVANGQKLPSVTFTEVNAPFSIAVPLPATLIKVPEMTLQLQFSRVVMERGREHGLIFRRIEVR